MARFLSLGETFLWLVSGLTFPCVDAIAEKPLSEMAFPVGTTRQNKQYQHLFFLITPNIAMLRRGWHAAGKQACERQKIMLTLMEQKRVSLSEYGCYGLTTL